MSQRFALWTSAVLAVVFALVVGAVLVGPSMSTAGESGDTAAQQDDGIDRDGWVSLDWFGQPSTTSGYAMSEWDDVDDDDRDDARDHDDDDHDDHDEHDDDDEEHDDD